MLTREQPRPGSAGRLIDQPVLSVPDWAWQPCGRQTSAVTRADLDKEPIDVAQMFDDVASRYDLTNDVLSLGQDRQWRRAVVAAVDPQKGERVLDLAAGTGTSSSPFRDRGAFVVPCDFSQGMLAVGKQRRPDLAFVAGDGLRLPFADTSFDAVTISFGLRNLHDTEAGLAELLRVTRRGGRLVVCEFSHPTWAPFRTVYTEYLMRALPPVARAVSSNPDAYVYLAESIRAWPDQPGLAVLVQRAGWGSVGWRNLSGGIVALHRATAP
jgi:demethylmenaquinone methyltransferase/2-methoxy-6-polyprenyl-1,4-benzoquinol methylase